MDVGTQIELRKEAKTEHLEGEEEATITCKDCTGQKIFQSQIWIFYSWLLESTAASTLEKKQFSDMGPL